MKIAVLGLGYVGMTAAACLSKQGHRVFGIDVSDEKILQVNSGKSPIHEPGLDDLIKAGLEKGLISATKDLSVLAESDVAIVCVGTPSAPDGSHNMAYIADVSRQIAAEIDPQRERPLVVIYRSTIRPGTIEGLIDPIFTDRLGANSSAYELVYNPEFLREATAIKDFFEPPKIVVGTRGGQRSEVIDAINEGIDAPTFYVPFREAEFTKFVDNTFHAVKVAFANEIGRVSGLLGISAKTISEIFLSDTKLNISPYYLRPGGAFGGSCLPKDVRALQYISADVGAMTHLVDSLIRSNDAHKHYLFEYCSRDLAPGASVLMLGIAFKSDSDDLRESPNIDLARKLLGAGYKLSIYDPQVRPAALLGQNLGYAFSNIPALRELLVERDDALSAHYDLVIDTRGKAEELPLQADRIINVNTLA
ncbi:MAG: nucleotide sugar dehydrogenase [Candidatus Andeanibacterium colombiense]|uniref:UDP-glucose 6-dehydrogenase n=1 Tax=Candidatus Andeanibacterium colombiense TaxID=3121345 RepID=A0AAJ5X592_9SPHN|nr:MAG: nucleotide sugar dehydrogenase [Sphingomonadaceae bacterium]